MITLLNKFDDNYVLKKEDALKISLAYIIENNVESCLKDVLFDSNIKHLAQYNIKGKVIVFNDDKIIKGGYCLFDRMQKSYHIREDYYTYFLNYYYLFIIYHELTHVSQQSRYENNTDKNDIYSYLYELCSKLRKNDVTFYNNNHDMFPMEIEANNNGYYAAYELMKYTKLPGKECRTMYLQYLQSLLLNYKRINNYRITSPIEKLVESNQDDMKKINELLDKAKLSKMDRLDLGLDITPKEFDSIEKEKIKCLAKIK